MMGKIETLAAAATAALVLLSPAVASARGAPECRDEARRLCADVQPGSGRMLACLKDHEAELAPACREKLPAMERCHAEAERLCPPGDGRRAHRACLQQHRDALQAVCREAGGGGGM